MEILSTGEKIKRARIYKGITLKELCGDKISISKMSCIENGKVKADEDILKYIANRIDSEYDYLVKDVYEQIQENLLKIKSNKFKDEELEQNIKVNLSYAIDYKYYNLAFEFMHILIDGYLKKKKSENIQLYISKYYDLFQKNNSIENTITYFLDMADYLLLSEEYGEAIIYYDKLRNLVNFNELDKMDLVFYMVFYKESLCYSKMGENEKAYKVISKIINSADRIKDKQLLIKVYELYSILSIRNNSSDSKEYINKAIELQKDNKESLALLKSQYGEAYFDVLNYDEGIKQIEEAVLLYSSSSKDEYVYFLNRCIEILYNNKQYDKAYEITDEALNMAIIINDIKLIERIYYYKGSILQKQKKYREAEKYMNLSLDSLFKCGSKEERYLRYIEMGNLYYNLNDVKESVKYFTLSNRIKNNN